jgi:hypothetical protein
MGFEWGKLAHQRRSALQSFFFEKNYSAVRPEHAAEPSALLKDVPAWMRGV